jgi:hypothetical protein
VTALDDGLLQNDQAPIHRVTFSAYSSARLCWRRFVVTLVWINPFDPIHQDAVPYAIAASLEEAQEKGINIYSEGTVRVHAARIRTAYGERDA